MKIMKTQAMGAMTTCFALSAFFLIVGWLMILGDFYIGYGVLGVSALFVILALAAIVDVVNERKDYVRLIDLCNKYGYWSNEVRRFNNILLQNNGYDYMENLNDKLRGNNKAINF